MKFKKFALQSIFLCLQHWLKTSGNELFWICNFQFTSRYTGTLISLHTKPHQYIQNCKTIRTYLFFYFFSWANPIKIWNNINTFITPSKSKVWSLRIYQGIDCHFLKKFTDLSISNSKVSGLSLIILTISACFFSKTSWPLTLIK